MSEILVINTSDDVVGIHVLPCCGDDWWVNLDPQDSIVLNNIDDDIINFEDIEDYISVTTVNFPIFEGDIIGFSDSPEMVDWMGEGF